MNKTALSIQSVSHSFGTVQALKNVSLDVPKGELFGLIGPDGAGKTTLIRAILGLQTPDSGKFEILGTNRVEDPMVVKDRVGYLSQQFSLYEDMTVNENIDFFAAIHGVEKHEERKAELLAFTRMTDFGDRLAGQLSGGMKQKLALACTLIHHPELIILDEPTTGVDPISRRDFWKILADLIRQGLTILVATPYMDEADRCHRVALMNNGSLLSVATPADLRSALQKKVLEIIPENIRSAMEFANSSLTEYPAHLMGERIQFLTGLSDSPEPILLAIRESGNEIKWWRVTEPTMETIFIHQIAEQR